MIEKYSSSKVEKKWQEFWKENKTYKVDIKKAKKPFYNLVMFPYPSGDKLHIGHWYNFGPADSFGRYMKMKGHDVFEPMGYDAFGLPAENYAVKSGIHPAKTTAKNVKYMKKQLEALGAMYDWDKEINTSSPDYYKWTQWLFLTLFKAGLAYRKKAPVNWCKSCKTVLANEQVQDGVCERCENEVIQKDMAQWFFKITNYTEELLDHSELDWPEKTILMQKHWIGRSEGIDIEYEVEGLDEKIKVYTTRPDTNFGATFIVVAPDSEFVKTNKDLFPNKKEVKDYVKEANKKTELERMADGRKKTGSFTGLYALNNLNGQKMPIYVSDFVLATVGTGCVVGVPGHDKRDFEFAIEKKLEIIRVVVGSDGDRSKITKKEQVQEAEGVMINSDFLDGMEIMKAKESIKDYLEKEGWGKRVINYRLRDWLLSRQRYWGAPIPIVYCEKCGEIPVPEKDLPVILPTNVKDYKPKGKSPLAAIPSFVDTKCPKCKGKAEREVDTMDTFVCSSWYFLRYPSANLKGKAFDMENSKKWLPVDMYIGGPEHACMHLLYARFINMALHDLGHVPHKEPFKKLIHQGMITKDGTKMSKSKGNVVSPDEFVKKYGSDVFRMYLMFMGPFTQGGDWNDKGITGIARFVDRFWTVMMGDEGSTDNSIIHKTIKKVTGDIEKMHFNTAISSLMELTNESLKKGMKLKDKKEIVKLIAPMAPHLAEEIWNKLGEKESIFKSRWPKYAEKYLEKKQATIAIQVNGKIRGTIEVNLDSDKETVLKQAKELPNVSKYIEGQKLKKEIYVPGRLVSLVI